MYIFFYIILFIIFFYFISIALTARLQDVWNEDEFIIALSNIKAKKKSGASNSIETLLAVKYKQKTKMMLILDRRTKRGEPDNSSGFP